ncbi:helix-turn-helix transcriptional regulator [Cupriavidus sp. D39]|uniref:helix-turn-helix transcriptional regulator n=1 Tax=Cupriavidus sp. D39 TaxID=2997877 RepID=UPI0022717234|nr:LuxR C-terminal-related transcriptional regulator [Cupriavidus sp. D39]MCY0853537.1 LuxR C-terminal-related transcriptional regulator [Cupriavidus sp. D39]
MMRMAPFREMLAGLTQLTIAQLDELRITIDSIAAEYAQHQDIGDGQVITEYSYGGTDVRPCGAQSQRLRRVLDDIGRPQFADPPAPSLRLRQKDEFDIYERCIENGLTMDDAAEMARLFINTAGLQRYQASESTVEPKPKVVRARLDIKGTFLALPLEAKLEHPDVAALPMRNFIDEHAHTNVSIVAVRDLVAGDESQSRRERSHEAANGTPSILEELGLTERQSVMLVLMLEGVSNKDIGHRLGLAESTIKQHVSAILHRLGARTRKEAMSRMKSLCLQELLAGDTACSGHNPCSEQDQSLAPAEGMSITPEELGLTPRQGVVLVALLEGLSNKLIARRLGLSENTVKEHVSAILLRLGFRTRMEVMSKMKHFCVRFRLT